MKIDTARTDLLWTYRDADNLIDDGFLAYFGFLCDVILYRKGGFISTNITSSAKIQATDRIEKFKMWAELKIFIEFLGGFAVVAIQIQKY